ncbi:hypothetical protein DPMN_075460 [Dreissena polymorpha]|uniref:Uncharacterized protein n=1 Tax=Dreissena polymorpha TaxID=45954 RepID=A0A9D3YL42_DREPO|nr:hypothetical protein DPMN_075460 [Dreissena polymorpha]
MRLGAVIFRHSVAAGGGGGDVGGGSGAACWGLIRLGAVIFRHSVAAGSGGAPCVSSGSLQPLVCALRLDSAMERI